MWTRYLLLLALIGSGQMFATAQVQAIACELENLYQITISNSPTIKRQHIQQQKARADKQSATGAFDYQLYTNLFANRSSSNLFNADPRVAIIGNQLKTNSISLTTGAQRTFRTGLKASAEVEYSRLADNFTYNSFNEVEEPFMANNATNATVSITQPLLKGRGREITTANEKAATISIESQRFQTAFVASGEVFSMILNYWQYLGANQTLSIYQENEARVQQMLDVTNELVKAEKKPESDLLQIQADLKNKEQQTIMARQQLYSAQQNLGRQAGLNKAASEHIGQPLNAFPEIEQITQIPSVQNLLEIAHQNRADIKALKRSLDTYSIYVDLAQNNVKPQLDLSAFVGYGGAGSGNGIAQPFSTLFKNEGRNHQFGIGLSYLYPVKNNRAEAALLNNKLLYSEQDILIKDQIRNIELNVNIAYNNFLNSIEALKKSKQALAYYEEVYQNEQLKFQNGLTTLLNLIIFQERLTFAQLEYINNQQQFAIAISNLRYETGTLLPAEETSLINQSADPTIFYQLPTVQE